MNKRLLLSKAYLCGPMDFAVDRGRGWRNEITPFLSSLGVIVLDPCNKPILKDETATIEDDDFAEQRKAALLSGNYDLVTKLMKPVRNFDLRCCDAASFIIVNLDLSNIICGTYEEIFISNLQKKPVIIHCPQGKKSIPPWLFAVLPHQMFFSTWDEVKTYLIHINSDEIIESYKRWHFFDIKDSVNRIINES